MKQGKRMSTETIVLGAVLTALVIVLQLAGAFIRFGPFSISLVLIPIVIGAATCGVWVSSWLGFVFGIAVLLSGDAAAFLAIDVPGTIITVLAKGIGCGFAAGFVYNLLKNKNTYVATIVAAIVCPIANTGIFLIGCAIFFLDTLAVWSGGGNVLYYMIFGLVGANFLFELGSNILLSPVVVRLLNIKNKK
ncbi:MAG: ECF transporter S component [Oscillospiraceae bacterium]|nr:ECF transporter S component [Oscillospiraceae bacterium]